MLSYLLQREGSNAYPFIGPAANGINKASPLSCLADRDLFFVQPSPTWYSGGMSSLDDRLRQVTTLHISAGFACNNDCIFCTDRGGQARRPDRPDPGQVRAVLEQNAHLGIVDFSTLEALLTPELPDYVAYARDLGYRIISLSTNGRVLPRRGRLEQLLAAGLNRFHLSMHGAAAPVHERITRRRGSFEQGLAGLRAIAEVRRQRPEIELFLHSTICALNVGALSGMVPFFLSFEPTHYGLNALQYQGAALEHLDEVAVPYSEVMQHLAPCLPERPRLPVTVSEIPLCITVRGLSVHYFGLREDYRLVEQGDEDAETTRVVAPERPLSHGPPCRDCVYRPHCEGVWDAYGQRYGWAEFVPLAGDDLEKLHFAPEKTLRRLFEPPGDLWRIKSIERSYERALVTLTSDRLEGELTIEIGPRDESKPAFRRTRRYNLGIRGRHTPPLHLALAEVVVRQVLLREG
jgi:hypothetical protein